MNSTEDLHHQDFPDDQETASCSSLHKDSDKNANISNHNKGAIPKVKALKQKLNNNEVVENGFTNKSLLSVCNMDHGTTVCDCLLNKENTCDAKDTVDSSSSDELLSISDDGCIYTFKADDSADLPNSFYNLNIAKSAEQSPARDSVSPEMDFLEMDFDPGPSGSGDSDSLSMPDGDNASSNLSQEPVCNNEIVNEVKETDTCEKETLIICNVNETVPVKTPEVSPSNPTVTSSLSTSSSNAVRPVHMPWSCSLRQRTGYSLQTSGRLTNYHRSCDGELSLPTNNELHEDRLEQVMIWSDEEACKKQKTQIGPSACGATAVLNVLNALQFPIPSMDEVQSVIKTRYRTTISPLAHYLVSRSIAGSTHDDIIIALDTLTDGQVYSRFFHMYPERVVNLNWWLHYWISQGAVPIATLNLQKCIGSIPDAWHHQMIFGVGPCGVYLTNPLECVKPDLLWPQLSSDSVLLVRREDVLSRWSVHPSLDQLMGIRDRTWSSFNVVGQVSNLVCESHREYRPGFTQTQHIKIPASYSAGITLTLRKDSPGYTFLQNCPELPLLPSTSDIYNTNIF